MHISDIRDGAHILKHGLSGVADDTPNNDETISAVDSAIIRPDPSCPAAKTRPFKPGTNPMYGLPRLLTGLGPSRTLTSAIEPSSTGLRCGSHVDASPRMARTVSSSGLVAKSPSRLELPKSRVPVWLVHAVNVTEVESYTLTTRVTTYQQCMMTCSGLRWGMKRSIEHLRQVQADLDKSDIEEVRPILRGVYHSLPVIFLWPIPETCWFLWSEIIFIGSERPREFLFHYEKKPCSPPMSQVQVWLDELET